MNTTQPHMKGIYYTLAGAAYQLGVTKKKLRGLVSCGRVQSEREGRQYLFLPLWLETYKASRLTQTITKPGRPTRMVADLKRLEKCGWGRPI